MPSNFEQPAPQFSKGGPPPPTDTQRAAPHDDEPPFKPFTMDEVRAITGIYTGSLEAWLRTTLGLKRGDDNSQGLDWMQTFAVYCGRRWLDAGAGPERSTVVVRFVSGLTEPGMRAEFKRGRVFPQHTKDAPPMLLPKPKGKLGEDLNLKALYAEYRAAVDRVFPRREA